MGFTDTIGLLNSSWNISHIQMISFTYCLQCRSSNWLMEHHHILNLFQPQHDHKILIRSPIIIFFIIIIAVTDVIVIITIYKLSRCFFSLPEHGTGSLKYCWKIWKRTISRMATCFRKKSNDKLQKHFHFSTLQPAWLVSAPSFL